MNSAMNFVLEPVDVSLVQIYNFIPCHVIRAMSTFPIKENFGSDSQLPYYLLKNENHKLTYFLLKNKNRRQTHMMTGLR